MFTASSKRELVKMIESLVEQNNQTRILLGDKTKAFDNLTKVYGDLQSEQKLRERTLTSISLAHAQTLEEVVTLKQQVASLTEQNYRLAQLINKE